MSESKYQDEEIKRRIEEKLQEQGKSQVWKSKGSKEFKQNKSTNKKIPQAPFGTVPSLQLLTPPQLFAFPTFANFSQYHPFVKNISVNSGLKFNSQGLNLGESVKDSQGLLNENSSRLQTDIFSGNIKSKFEENEVDHFFENALNFNKISEKEEILTKSVKESKNSLSSEEIKRFIDDLNKNKEIIQRSREKITSTKMDLHLTTKKEKSRENSPEMKLDYDVTKIPSFLNAYSYSNYFYQNNIRENKSEESICSQASDEQLKVFYFNQRIRVMVIVST